MVAPPPLTAASATEPELLRLLRLLLARPRLLLELVKPLPLTLQSAPRGFEESLVVEAPAALAPLLICG